jgi:cbb3-type cytochrome oxidase maturation protein
MEILYLLIPLSVALAFLIGAAFWWSVGSGQFDDLEGPAHRILLDDDGWTPASSSNGAEAIDLYQSPARTPALTSAARYPEPASSAANTLGLKERNR